MFPRWSYVESNEKDNRKKSSYSEIIDVESKKSYIFAGYLGSGTFGHCFKLKTNGSSKLFAAKFVGASKKRPKIWREIEKEVSIHQGLRHKNIIGFIDQFNWNGYTIFLLEYCQFGSLSEVLERRQVVIELEARYYIQQVLSALSYLRSKLIIHGDIKPANILITRKMRVKVGDFGLSDILRQDRLISGGLLQGTPNYMAPEIVGGQSYGFPSDIWAAGCTFYVLLSGKPPFEANDLPSTIENILSCNFSPYCGIRRQTVSFMKYILQVDPSSRPTADQILSNRYFTYNFTPPSLPEICLYRNPDLTELMTFFKKNKAPRGFRRTL